MKNYMDVIGVISLVLAVLAMIVALWHVHSIHEAAKRLDDVRRSLSTRYIGQFPEFFPEIVSLLKSAKREIVIFCDFPAYACFSDPHTFLEYQHTLQRKAQHEEVRVIFTCLGSTYRSKGVQDQFFSSSQEWDEWKRDPNIEKRLCHFLSFRRGVPTIDELGMDQFLELLERIEQRTLEETFASAQVREIDAYIPVYFWLVDGMNAVFAIPADKTLEYGFSTTDQKLISALVLMRDQYHRGIAATTGPQA